MIFVRRVLLAVALPIALLAVWWFTSADSQAYQWPPLSRILQAFLDTWTPDKLRTDVLPSLIRLGAGYALALVAGIALGVLIGGSAGLRAYLEPVLEFMRAIPPPVVVPIIMLVLGIGDTMKIVVIAFGCVWPILLNTVEGVRGRDEVLDDTCRTYGIRGGLRLRHLVLRAASPQILTGARQALSIAIILMVISELFAAENGLGFTVMQFSRGFEIPEMWSGVFLLGLLGVVLAVAYRLVERWLLRWYHGARAHEREW
ncbi:ABC-type nitrate/sulfonate/bicarbonate transport system permease component [Hamadaea flava]|uniref:ABC transporter permease n=1 Tax=Hamadaea flava TaxID=1742688 RepID=A0ABV8LW49_9ACTN|nr:ABC transporter permease subunit [Hamadaea flava]MCP2328821.1 ABC-type nitrate/sulfonate/bicarbonate transport system permease component [Hamadaea flava]